ncbi:hypothetical protein HDU96_009999, partial [Phlyctochytrium bullatum]
MVFVEPIPNEDPPQFTESDRRIPNLVYAPHWYDLKTLFSKDNLINFTLWNYNPMNDNEYGDYWNGEDFSIYSPKPSRAKTAASNSVTSINSLLGQPQLSVPDTGRLKKERGKSKLTDITPLVIEDTIEASPTLAKSTSREQLPTTPFEITNIYFQDDELALEGDPDHHHHEGGRALDALIRPYAAKIAGIPLVSKFNLRTLTYTLEFMSFPGAVSKKADRDDKAEKNEEFIAPISLVTEIFIPNYHFGYANGIKIEASDGEWRYDKKKQTLYWVHATETVTQGERQPLISHAVRHRIKISVPGYKNYEGIFGWLLWL